MIDDMRIPALDDAEEVWMRRDLASDETDDEEDVDEIDVQILLSVAIFLIIQLARICFSLQMSCTVRQEPLTWRHGKDGVGDSRHGSMSSRSWFQEEEMSTVGYLGFTRRPGGKEVWLNSWEAQLVAGVRSNWFDQSAIGVDRANRQGFVESD
ncbi:hypothetical protein IEQ34_002249 [Dendrobium chrysotoxum]|uniref:Uncharacterized protein n=1 Tax=Dendrobium chrysotoxum TaxID=161865 RepID=A0AAV7HJD9_DENCH|nr:hypothetical protein IEQ34_002249 [Dendrobium chrysotoxum]